MFEACKIVEFMVKLSEFAADVLLLSLFESPEALLVYNGKHPTSNLSNEIRQILTTGEPSVVPLKSFFRQLCLSLDMMLLTT